MVISSEVDRRGRKVQCLLQANKAQQPSTHVRNRAKGRDRAAVFALLAGIAVGALLGQQMPEPLLYALFIPPALYWLHWFLVSRGIRRVGRLKIGEILVGLGLLAAFLLAVLSAPDLQLSGGTLAGILILLAVGLLVYGLGLRTPE